MRTRHTTQYSIFRYRPEHEISRILAGVSAWLYQHSEVLEWIEQDVCEKVSRFGRAGMLSNKSCVLGGSNNIVSAAIENWSCC